MKRPLAYWILGSILFQIGMFVYLDRIVFAPAVSFTQRAVVDEQAAQIISSPDNTSFAYIGGGWMKVYHHQEGYVGDFAVPEEGKVTYFEYYPEKNRVIAGVTLLKNGAATVICQEINSQNNQAQEWQINSLAKGAAVIESAYAGVNDVLYFLLREGSSAYLYRPGQELKRIKTNTTQINRIAGFPIQDVLLFDNKSKGAVYSLDSQGEIKQLALPKGSYSLIGIDKEERIYLGQLSDKKKITTLIAGDPESGFVSINKYAKPLDPEALRISTAGELLVSP